MDEQIVSTDESASSLPAGQADAPVNAGGSVAVAPGSDNGSVNVANGDGRDSAQVAPPVNGLPANAQADADEFQLPENDDDLRGLHPKQAQNLKGLRDHARRLKADLMAAKDVGKQYEGWNAVQEEYGDATAVLSNLQRLKALNEYERDEAGQLVRDPQTGMPRLTANNFVRELWESERPTVERLYQSIWKQPVDEQGTTFGEQQFERMLGAMGVSPDAFMSFVESGGQVNAQVPTQAGVNKPPSAEELQYVPKEYHEAFAACSAKERERLLYQSDEGELVEALAAKQDQLNDKRRLADIDQQLNQQREAQQQEQQRYQETFVRETQAAQETHLADLRNNIATEIKTALAQEWKPTENAQTNEAMYGYAVASLFNLLTPEYRALTESQFAAVGVQIEPDTYSLLDDLTVLAQETVQRQRIAKDQRLAHLHDPAALQLVEKQYDQLKKRIQVRATRYARAIAQPLMTGFAGAASQQSSAIAQASQVRPTVSSVPQGGAPQAPAQSWQELMRKRAAAAQA